MQSNCFYRTFWEEICGKNYITTCETRQTVSNCDKYMKLLQDFLFCVNFSKFAQILKSFAQSCDCMIAAFRNSGSTELSCIVLYYKSPYLTVACVEYWSPLSAGEYWCYPSYQRVLQCTVSPRVLMLSKLPERRCHVRQMIKLSTWRQSGLIRILAIARLHGLGGIHYLW